MNKEKVNKLALTKVVLIQKYIIMRNIKKLCPHLM